jgi:hypothetical protein
MMPVRSHGQLLLIYIFNIVILIILSRAIRGTSKLDLDIMWNHHKIQAIALGIVDCLSTIVSVFIVYKVIYLVRKFCIVVFDAFCGILHHIF